jgi:hypothetical protein
MHLKGRLSVNLVLVVVFLLNGEDFLVCEEDVFMPVFGVPLKEMLCSCSSYLLKTASAQVPEGTVVQQQPSLQPSCLIVSSFGQHESCNRNYGRTMYRKRVP